MKQKMWNKGKKCLQLAGKNHWNWQGGISKQIKYCIDCSKEIKRFSTRCFSCRLKFSRGKNAAHWQNAKIETQCNNCKKAIIKYRFEIKNYKNHFCSEECRNRYYSGKNSIRWKGGLPKCIDCGRKLSRRTYKRCILCSGKFYHKEKHHCWKGGISNEPYSFDFNDELKERIKKRDNFICQICKITEEEHLIVFGQPLCIHHINYNKLNSEENNLITLCHSCHTRTNFNRNYWKEYFNKSEVIKNGLLS